MSRDAGELTDDTLFDGQLVCRQYLQGYRFSVDAVLAAHFCTLRPRDHVLDLGCGSGVIGLILAYRYTELQVTGLEFQPELAKLASDNVSANSMSSRFSIIEGDLRHISTVVSPESFDLVVSNPPYRDPGTGRMSPDNQRAKSRHEIHAKLDDVVSAAAFAVKNRGRVVFIYPATRAMTLVAALKRRNLEPKRLQSVYSYPGDEDASLVLVESVKNGGEELRILPPFYIYAKQNGAYSVQMQKIYG